MEKIIMLYIFLFISATCLGWGIINLDSNINLSAGLFSLSLLMFGSMIILCHIEEK